MREGRAGCSPFVVTLPRMMKARTRIRFIAAVTITYILLALAWWSILLYRKNEAVYRQQVEIIALQERLGMAPEMTAEAYRTLEERHGRQRLMVVGEALFILASVGIGIWLMLRGFSQEIRINQQRRNFLLSVTHELKTPVAAVRLVLETFKKHQLSADKREELSQRGLRETERLQETLDKILLAARLGQQYVPHPERRTVAERFTAWVEDFKTRWPNNRLQLDLGPLPREAELDWQGLETIFRNLTENAARYAPDGTLKVQAALKQGRMVLQVADTGPGIPDSQKDRVFDMFHRMGNEDQRTHQGSGLGLYIVREIAGRNRGICRVTDNDPHGAVFTIELPVHETNTGR